MSSYDNQNVFAKILREELPCKKVYEDESILAFHDAYPKAPVHILVIPKKSYTSFNDFIENSTAEEIGKYYKVVYEIAKKFEISNGYKVSTNIGKDGGQVVPHFHTHILGGTNLKGIHA